jgi:hypothetical protein
MEKRPGFFSEKMEARSDFTRRKKTGIQLKTVPDRVRTFESFA